MLAGMAGANGVGHVHIDNAFVMLGAIAIVLLAPTSQDLALGRLRPVAGWLALPAGAALVFLLLLIGGRVPNEFIYFQF
jgi:hypothetical protein